MECETGSPSDLVEATMNTNNHSENNRRYPSKLLLIERQVFTRLFLFVLFVENPTECHSLVNLSHINVTFHKLHPAGRFRLRSRNIVFLFKREDHGGIYSAWWDIQFAQEEKLGGWSNPAINLMTHSHKLPRTNLLVCQNNSFLD